MSGGYGSHLRAPRPRRPAQIPQETPEDYGGDDGYAPGYDTRFPTRRPRMPATPELYPDMGCGPDDGIEAYRDVYRRIAKVFGGRDLPEGFTLRRYLYNDQTVVNIRDDGALVALDAQQPSQTLNYEFQFYAVVTDVTSVVQAPRLTAEGQPDPGFFDNMNARDYIQARMQPVGLTRVWSSNRMPLSEFSGPGTRSGMYPFEPMPWVNRGQKLQVELDTRPFKWSNPPGIVSPFLMSVGLVSITFHVLEIPELGD